MDDLLLPRTLMAAAAIVVLVIVYTYRASGQDGTEQQTVFCVGGSVQFVSAQEFKIAILKTLIQKILVVAYPR